MAKATYGVVWFTEYRLFAKRLRDTRVYVAFMLRKFVNNQFWKKKKNENRNSRVKRKMSQDFDLS